MPFKGHFYHNKKALQGKLTYHVPWNQFLLIKNAAFSCVIRTQSHLRLPGSFPVKETELQTTTHQSALKATRNGLMKSGYLLPRLVQTFGPAMAGMRKEIRLKKKKRCQKKDGEYTRQVLLYECQSLKVCSKCCQGKKRTCKNYYPENKKKIETLRTKMKESYLFISSL